MESIAELKAWISANVWKSEQVAGWVKAHFYDRTSFVATSAGTQHANLPVKTGSDGLIDESLLPDTRIDNQTITAASARFHIDATSGDPSLLLQESGTTQWSLTYSTTGNYVSLNEFGVADQLKLADGTGDATFTGDVFADNFYTQRIITLDDDTATSITPTGTVGIVMVAGVDSATVAINAAFRAAASRWMTSLGAGSNTNTSTSQLTGTTGTDGKFTVSAFSDGAIYFENRLGSQQRFNVIIIS
jgi:hypothetical protein